MVRRVVISVAFLFLSLNGLAQVTGVGLFNSPKGFGVVLETEAGENDFNVFTAYADMYGIFEGRCLYPGFKFNYTRGRVLKVLTLDGIDYSFYAGPGITAGYSRQYEPYVYKDYRKYLIRNYGLIACLSGTAGCRIGFGKSILLDLSWTVEAGVHMRLDEDHKGLKLGLYKNGLISALYPQLTLIMAF